MAEPVTDAAGPLPGSHIQLPPKDEAIPPRPGPEVRALPMTELEKEGTRLATWVLLIIAGLALILLMLVAKSEFHDTPAETLAAHKVLQAFAASTVPPTAENVEKALQAMQKITEARQAAREFWKDLIQIVLVNIFLPVLTAVLGYIFGTSRGSSNGGRPS